jgi:hypothetical protein
MSNKEKITDTLGLGFLLWLAGFLASIPLYFIAPKEMLGWILYVVFTPITLYVAYWRFHRRTLPGGYYLMVAAVWTLTAVSFDYIFIVILLKAADYYQLDIFLYYATIFLIPVFIGSRYAKK